MQLVKTYPVYFPKLWLQKCFSMKNGKFNWFHQLEYLKPLLFNWESIFQLFQKTIIKKIRLHVLDMNCQNLDGLDNQSYTGNSRCCNDFSYLVDYVSSRANWTHKTFSADPSVCTSVHQSIEAKQFLVNTISSEWYDIETSNMEKSHFSNFASEFFIPIPKHRPITIVLIC